MQGKILEMVSLSGNIIEASYPLGDPCFLKKGPKLSEKRGNIFY